MKVNELLIGIQKKDIVLPEFQREYVWSLEQSKQLMVSLFNGYPVGALLFWTTDTPPEIKNYAVNPKKIGTITVILDGQQRLTTLYILLKNEIPPYYIDKDIKYDPRHLYFNLETGEFQYYQPAIMKNNPLWVRVIDCFSPDSKINVFSIAKQLSKEDTDPFELANKLNDNLTKLRNIQEKDFPVQFVPSTAGIDEAIDIFDRVNSLGTKLTDAELALTHITGKWPEARRILKKKIRELEKRNFYFDLGFMVRCLVGIVKGRALFETIHKTPKENVIEGWNKLDKILDYLTTILPKHAYIHSTEDVNTTNIFVPLVVYLSKNGNVFPNENSLKNAIRWLYLAHLWGRYAGQTDQRLDHDINIIMRNGDPWQELVNVIVDQRGRIKLEASDLEGRSIQHPIYRMLYILIKSKGAIDWFNGSPLDITHGESYYIHSHHIFPSSLLWKLDKYNENNHLHKKIINEIANRAFLTATTNISAINNKSPKIYFEEIKSKFGEDALKKQLVPTDENLLDLDKYEEFLKVRRELIAKEINKFIEQFTSREVEERKITVADYIRLGESSAVEFKSTLRWDLIQNKINKALEKVIIKTIAGFLNSEGGTLLIGVSDDGNVIGIEKDLETLKKKDIDGFQQLLVHLITNYLGVEYVSYIKINFEEVNGKKVCIVKVDNSPQPVFVKEQNIKEFYIRAGNLTKLLDSEKTYNYIQIHWQ
jgi:hypothetical protein